MNFYWQSLIYKSNNWLRKYTLLLALCGGVFIGFLLGTLPEKSVQYEKLFANARAGQTTGDTDLDTTAPPVITQNQSVLQGSLIEADPKAYYEVSALPAYQVAVSTADGTRLKTIVTR